MPNSKTTLAGALILLTTMAWQFAPQAAAEAQGDTAAQGPRAVVARWLEMHRTGRRDEAKALTTGTPGHRADVLLPSMRDSGVRVERSLGNEASAAVVTGPLKDDKDGERLLLFWLVRRNGSWLINKSNSFDSQVVDERLRGFLEANGVRWHVQRDQLVGHWEAAACTTPGGVTACGSRLELGDKRFRLVAWGPFGSHPEYDDILQGGWRLADNSILLSHGDKTYECLVTWIGARQLEIKSTDGKIRAAYRRTATDKIE